MGAAAESFKIKSGDPIIIYVLIGLALLIGLIWLGRFLYTDVYLKSQQVRQEWARFHHVCRRRKLTAAEIEFLSGVVKKYQLPRPVFLVRFMETFNRYMYREVETTRGQETKRRERFLTFVFNLRKKLGFANFSRLEELTSSREVKQGQRIRVTIEIANLEKKITSKIHEVDEDGIKITLPDRYLDEEPVREGHAVKFVAVHREDAEYTFRTTVFKVIPGPPEFLYLNHSRSFTRTQRRKYTRLDGEFVCRYFRLTHLQKKEFRERRTATVTSETIWQDDVIRNLSAGGFVFPSSAPFDDGAFLGVSLRLSENSEELKDMVGCVERTLNKEGENDQVIVRFVKIPEKVRDTIARHIYRCKSGDTEKTKKPKAKTGKKKTANTT